MGRKGEEGAEVCLMPRGAVTTVRCNRMFLVYGLGRREDSEGGGENLSAEKHADKNTLKGEGTDTYSGLR